MLDKIILIVVVGGAITWIVCGLIVAALNIISEKPPSTPLKWLSLLLHIVYSVFLGPMYFVIMRKQAKKCRELDNLLGETTNS